MNPQHLYYLQAIVEQGSMAKAAERLRVTQPTLSRIVKTLEEQAGAPLLHRERYGVSDRTWRVWQDGRQQPAISYW